MYLPRKSLIQMSGAPGSGKSTIANLLAQSIDAVVVKHDLIKAFFLESNTFDQSGTLAHRFDWVLAEDVIKQARSVIIDCPCNSNEIIDQGTALARKYGYEYSYVECRVTDVDLLDRRLRNRVPLRGQPTGVSSPPPDASDARYIEDYRALFTQWIEDPCRPSSDTDTIVVNSTDSPEECLDYILKQIVPPNSIDHNASSRLPAVLGGIPTFSTSNYVPQIFPSGYSFVGEYNTINSILCNEPNLEPTRLSSRQRYVSRGAVKTPSYRSDLQGRVAECLGLDAYNISVICVTSGTNALRAALKAVIADGRTEACNKVIVPAITAASTVEAVIMEGFVPVIVDVNPDSWMLSPEATARAISDGTAAIVTVDWLGTICDLRPFRKLADQYGIKLISDSAQSFGATQGKPPALTLADATIYSTGYPKVFHTGGAGGIVVCSASQLEWLEQEPSDILRHEVMPEMNAYLGLRALDRLPRDLKARAEAAEMYRSLLHHTPGIAFQDLASKLGTNHYQLSVTVDAGSFGLDAKTLCQALQAENILAYADRMLCLGVMPRLLWRCEVAGDLSVSRALGENSLTFPISNQSTPDLCQRICFCVKAIYERSGSIALIKSPVVAPPPRERQSDIMDIAGKFKGYWVVPSIDDREFASRTEESGPWTILIQWRHFVKRKISIDELHRQILSRCEWRQGDEIINGLIVHAKVGETVLVLTPHDGGCFGNTNAPIYLDESGSAASVTLVLGHNGDAKVQKTCSHDGIDGNGRPWIENQRRFLELSAAVRKTDMIVKPLEYRAAEGSEGTVSITFPYVPSHSLSEMMFAGMEAGSLLAVLQDLLGEMATSLWPEGAIPAPDDFIEQAHFNRIRRRVRIVRAEVPELDAVAGYEWLTLNGRRLLGFERVLEALTHHSTMLKEISPRTLGEIHGDLNIHNILCQLRPDANRPVVLVDPRGVPLLRNFAGLDILEPGDYAYDLSKLKFSLSGFSEIRKGFYKVQGEGRSFEFFIKDHPASDILRSADHGFIRMLSSNKRLIEWIETVEPSGFRSLELRVLLGEAAHFVADAACALGRNKTEEVLPLFLIGLAKLNDFLERMQGEGDPSVSRLIWSVDMEAIIESPNYGARIIRSALLGSSDAAWTWDVLEVLVKSESTHAAYRLLSELIGEYLPEGTGMHVSTHAVERIRFPCVLIHPFVAVRGQTDAVLSGIRRTQAFLRDGKVAQGTIDRLKIITITSTGASINSQYVSRQNDKLLAPGPWGISPLRLIILEVNQLPFPRSGRWIVENDSFLVLSRALRAEGDCLCLLTSKRPGTNSSSWRNVCVESAHDIDGRNFATGFREISPHETETELLKPTGAMFIPYHLGKALADLGEAYTARSSPLLVDFVLPRFMRRVDWIGMCHAQGFGVNSDLAWSNAERIANLSPQVELAYGGEQMMYRHFGSDSEYTKLVDDVGGDPLLAGLTYLPSMAKWLQRYHRQQNAN